MKNCTSTALFRAAKRSSSLLAIGVLAGLLLINTGCGDDMPVEGVSDAASADVTGDAGLLGDASDKDVTSGDATASDGGVTCEKNEDCKDLASTCVKAACGAGGVCELTNLAKGDKCSDDDECTPDDTCDGEGVCLPGAATSCDDGNPCTADSCDKKKGCLHDPAGTDCSDGDACTEGDSCSGGVCQAGTTKLCDDSNPCTDDTCDPAKGCVYTNNTAACDDGDACSKDDTCAAGACAPGSKVDCDDNEVCTTDSCDKTKGCVHTPAAGDCSDGDACTLGDTCGNGACLPGSVTACDDGNVCTDDGCDKKTGCLNLANAATCSDDDACTTDDICKGGACQPGAAAECDDKNPCTADSCDAKKGCTTAPMPKTTTCTDDNACTGMGGVDACDGAGLCASGPVNDCDDSNACTTDSCDPVKGCKHANNTKPCTDGDVCTTGDACKDGACGGGSKFDCDDGNPCTTDSCDKKKGCQHANNTMPCDDNNSCTTDEKCSGGSCKAVTPSKCDDGNDCTTESCDPVKGCQSKNNTVACSDGDVCTQNDVCKGGSCVAGAMQACTDGNVCTKDSCDAKKGCLNVPAAAKCSDDNACTSDDACKNGDCVATLTFSCDDSQVCTADSCDPKKGCQHKNIDVPCSDGNDCTGGDKCDTGKCIPGKKLDCDDGNVCTVDLCTNNKDGSGGCAHKPVPSGGLTEAVIGDGGLPQPLPKGVTCTDNDACTTIDICHNGKCVGGPAAKCDDGNVCTADACDPKTGCVHKNVAALCTDGNVCTLGDVCKAGKCTSTGKLSCTDGNLCTDDSCDKKTGCTFTANSAKCDDGNACTTGDLCKGGTCRPGVGKPCDDGNPCTDDSCSVAMGCIYKANTAACSDGNQCTVNDICANKKCTAGGKRICNDGNPCTDDSCDPKKGCIALPNTISCDDGDSCTANDTCSKGKCLGKPTIDCDDKNVCTTDKCDAKTGCTNLPNSVTCTDGNACTKGDACKDKACLSGKPLVCNDNNICTMDSCDKLKGCVATPLKDGTTCGGTGTCTKGGCVCPAESWLSTKGCLACGCSAVGSVASGTGFKLKTILTEKGASAYDQMGYAIAADGGWLAVGVPYDDDKGSGSGSVLLYQKQASGVWQLKQKVYAKTPGTSDYFGFSVAMSAGTLAIGAYNDDDRGGNAGAVYVFALKAGVWSQRAKLFGSGVKSGQQFGRAVAVSGGRIAATALYGAKVYQTADLYVFAQQNDGSWKQEALLNDSAAKTYDHSGRALAMSGGRIVMSSQDADPKGSGSGKAVVFERQSNGSYKQGVVVPADGAAGDVFSFDVAIDGDWLAASAPLDDDKASNAGSVYVFKRQSDGSWKQMQKLISATAKTADQFGWRVTLRKGMLLVGAPYDDDKGTSSGTVTRYTMNTAGVWQLAGAVAGASGSQQLGYSVALDGAGGMFAGGIGYSSYRGMVAVFSAASYSCGTTGQCQCKPGYGGMKCDKVVNACAIAGYCDDKNACTVDSCNKTTKKCVNTPVKNGTTCTDGDACTGKDTCQSGKCTAGAKVVCNDNSPCTTDTCDTAKGCVYTAIPDPSYDKKLTQKMPSSRKNTFSFSGMPTPSGAIGLTIGAKGDYDQSFEYVNVYVNNKFLAKFDPKSSNWKYMTYKVAASVIVGGKLTVRVDSTSSVSTSLFGGAFNSVQVKYSTPSTKCSDGSACTQNDYCKGGKCIAGTKVICNDNNPCTTDSCDPKKGCLATVLKDGTVCAPSTTCKAGKCTEALLGAPSKPAKSCYDLLVKRPELKGKDGTFYITTAKQKSLAVFCDMTTDGGGYTTYAVASGKKTYKYTDPDSCKDLGLTMVIPRTKAHYGAMMKKYGSSYFKTVPGVYKPTSKGNYTNCAMRDPKTFGSGCANWRVGDGGPWWIRDSKYVEPNGDYTAYCWLLQQKWDVNDIRFNDGYCSYSTTKYLCSTNDKYGNFSALGTKAQPASSCKDLLAKRPELKGKDAAYWLDPDGAKGYAAFQAWCDMTLGGGGWTLVMKTNGASTTLNYESAYWTNTSTFNTTSLNMTGTDAKFTAFINQPFTQVLAGMKRGSSATRWLSFNYSAASMRAAMSGGFKPVKTTRSQWLGVVGTGATLQKNCNRMGFNNYHSYSRVRLGILGNQENDCNSPDSRIGFGGNGNACSQDATVATGNSAGTCDTAKTSIKAYGYLLVR